MRRGLWYVRAMSWAKAALVASLGGLACGVVASGCGSSDEHHAPEGMQSGGAAGEAPGGAHAGGESAAGERATTGDAGQAGERGVGGSGEGGTTGSPGLAGAPSDGG